MTSSRRLKFVSAYVCVALAIGFVIAWVVSSVLGYSFVATFAVVTVAVLLLGPIAGSIERSQIGDSGRSDRNVDDSD
jgi:fatty acid desaturase